MAPLVRKYLHVRFLCPDPDDILSMIAAEGVELRDITYLDALTVQVRVAENAHQRLKGLLKPRGISCQVVKKQGLFWNLHVLYRRPVLLVGILLFLAISFWTTGRIFAVRVEGNVTIPEKYILKEAADCGIRFGSRIRQLRSEKVKNDMLQKIPALQWVGINTKGTVATIRVRERSIANETEAEGIVSSIVASQDGIIYEVVVERGSALCSVGQQVKKGDVLISGYTDCGMKIQAEKAEGEIYAFTQRQRTFICIKPDQIRGGILHKKLRYSLRVGKKVIKLWNDSGISDTTCGKMYAEEFWSLPGDFILPVSLIRETWLLYDPLPSQDAEKQDPSWLISWAENYIRQEMVAGEILEQSQQMQENAYGFTMHGVYHCREMIGQVKYEETLKEHAQNH